MTAVLEPTAFDLDLDLDLTVGVPAEDPLRRAVRSPRGRGVLAALVLTAIGAVVVWAPWAPTSDPGPRSGVGAELVTVGPGDTWYSIATEHLRGMNPAESVATLRSVNSGLADLRPGDVVALPSGS